MLQLNQSSQPSLNYDVNTFSHGKTLAPVQALINDNVTFTNKGVNQVRVN